MINYAQNNATQVVGLRTTLNHEGDTFADKFWFRVIKLLSLRHVIRLFLGHGMPDPEQGSRQLNS